MAGLPGTPRTWADGLFVTEDIWDEEVRDSLRYLRGISGPTTRDSTVLVPGLVSSFESNPEVLARHYVREDEDAPAAVIENLKSTGTPHALQINMPAVAGPLHKSITIASGSLADVENLEDHLSIDGDGVLYVNTQPRWQAPFTVVLQSDFNVPFLATAIPTLAMSIPRVGWWYVSVHFHIQILGDTTIEISPGVFATNNVPFGIFSMPASGIYVEEPLTRSNTTTIATARAHALFARALNITTTGTLNVMGRTALDHGGSFDHSFSAQFTYATAWYMGN